MTAPAPHGILDSASKLGHLCTADDPLIARMIESFHQPTPVPAEVPAASVTALDLHAARPLPRVLAVGGAFSSLPNPLAPHKVLGYVKIATARIDLARLARARAPVVDPEALRRVLCADADTRATVLPLGNVRIPGKTLFQSVRHALHATFERFLDGALYDTLEFLVSHAWEEDPEAWRAESPHRPRFVCPCCDAFVTFPRPAVGRRRGFRCHACRGELSLVDYLGLISDASDSTSESAVAMNLKGVLEHLLLLTFLRRQGEGSAGSEGSGCLLLKDGPLMLRGQSARLVEPIRAYLRHRAGGKAPTFLCGVEQEGAFATHRAEIEPWFVPGVRGAVPLFVPDNRYVLERIKHAGGAAAVYGRKGLYGSKAFCRLDETSLLVLSLPNRRHGLGEYAADPAAEDLVGLDRVLATLRELTSRQFPGVPLPLLAVNRLCELPYYPTNNLLDPPPG